MRSVSSSTVVSPVSAVWLFGMVRTNLGADSDAGRAGHWAADWVARSAVVWRRIALADHYGNHDRAPAPQLLSGYPDKPPRACPGAPMVAPARAS